MLSGTWLYWHILNRDNLLHLPISQSHYPALNWIFMNDEKFQFSKIVLLSEVKHARTRTNEIFLYYIIIIIIIIAIS